MNDEMDDEGMAELQALIEKYGWRSIDSALYGPLWHLRAAPEAQSA